MLQEMSRLQHAISMRCLVVSQRSLEPDLDAEWGDKLVITDDKDIPKQLKYYLDHPKEREARVEKAYRHSKENYRLKDWLRKSTFLKHYMNKGAGTHPWVPSFRLLFLEGSRTSASQVRPGGTMQHLA